jgi:hypothetical protein
VEVVNILKEHKPLGNSERERLNVTVIYSLPTNGDERPVCDESIYVISGDRHGGSLCWLGERFGSGDGERKTLLTRQIAFEPLPASVLFALVRTVVMALERLRMQ